MYFYIQGQWSRVRRFNLPQSEARIGGSDQLGLELQQQRYSVWTWNQVRPWQRRQCQGQGQLSASDWIGISAETPGWYYQILFATTFFFRFTTNEQAVEFLK